MRKPDFRRIRKALLLEGEPDFVPMFDGVDRDLKSAFLDKPVRDFKGDIDFAQEAGYDFVHIMVGLRTLLGWGGHYQKTKVSMTKPLFRSTKSHYSALDDQEGERNWAEEGTAQNAKPVRANIIIRLLLSNLHLREGMQMLYVWLQLSLRTTSRQSSGGSHKL